MPTRIDIPDGIIEHIAIAIERLWVPWPHWVAELLFLRVTQGKPRPKLVFLVQCGDKSRLTETDRQWFEGDPIHAARSIAWHHRIRRDEPPEAGVVITGTMIQEPARYGVGMCSTGVRLVR